MNAQLDNARSRKCPVCNKRWTYTCRDDEWGYAYDGRLTCSYKCMREMAKIDAENQIDERANDRQNGVIAKMYKSHLLGVSYADLAKSGTAQYLGLTDADKVNRRLKNWAASYPDDAQMIREAVLLEADGVPLSEVVQQSGMSEFAVRQHASQLGIVGKRCGRIAYYTKDQARRIIASFRWVTA